MRHKISKLKIENFKSIKQEEFVLSDYTPLVGYNNAGKTNIIRAIKWLLEKSKLIESDFNDISKPVIVTAEIEGISCEILERLDVKHKNKIEEFVFDGKVKIRRSQKEPNVGTRDITLEVFDYNANSEREQWKINPTGIDNAIKALFPEPIHIGAMENAEEDVSKSKNTTTIGKLLSQIISPIEEQYGSQVRETIRELEHLFDSDGEEKASELVDFDNEINEKINDFFPNIKIKTHIPSPELREIFSKGTIKVYEGSNSIGADVSSLGHGAQRSIQMALVRHLADSKQQINDPTTTLLLIDEPELYLHPQAIEILRDALSKLSKQGYQVIFSTHSPFMITQRDIENTILVRKNETDGTHKKLTLKNAISEVETEARHQLSLLFELSHSSHILFAEYVILVEGKTEQRLLPFLIHFITGKTLALHKTALVKLDGSGNTKKTMRVLEVMGIPCRAIVDFDFAFKQAVNDGILDDDDTDLRACIDKLTELASREGMTLGNDGLPTKKSNMLTAEEVFAKLAQEEEIKENIDNLKQKLQDSNYWIWTKGSIEEHLNISGKNENVWATLINKIEEEGIEQTLPNDFEFLTECVNWILHK